jgi:hypothetical protein
MSLVPISRSTLQLLKAEKEQRDIREHIKTIVTRFHTAVIRIAESTDRTSYEEVLPKGRARREYVVTPLEFYREHLTHILSELRVYFPDCVVELRSRSVGLPAAGETEDYLVVDWS